MSVAYVDTSVLTAIAFDEPGAAAHVQRLGEFAVVFEGEAGLPDLEGSERSEARMAKYQRDLGRSQTLIDP